MADKVYIVGAYVSSDDPALRLRAYVPLATEFRTLAQAVAGAERDYRDGHGGAAGMSFVVYTAAGGDAVVEVSRGGPLDVAGFYKVAQAEVGEA